MDGFSYQNIFETKGIEYLAVIAFFMVLIPFWLILSRRVKNGKHVLTGSGILTLQKLRIPQGIFFGTDHTWAHLEKSGVASVGVDDLLLHITGEVNVLTLIKPGDRVRKGDIMAKLEQDGKKLGISAPVSGEIITVNSGLAENPGLLTEDPYSKGWIYRVKPDNWISETSNCYLAGEASWWIENELTRFRDFLSVSSARLVPQASGVILQDGGELSDNTLSGQPPEVWTDFQEYFLRNPGNSEIMK